MKRGKEWDQKREKVGGNYREKGNRTRKEEKDGKRKRKGEGEG